MSRTWLHAPYWFTAAVTRECSSRSTVRHFPTAVQTTWDLIGIISGGRTTTSSTPSHRPWSLSLYSFVTACFDSLGLDATRSAVIRTTITSRDLTGLSESAFLAATPPPNHSTHSQSLRSYRPQGATLDAQGRRTSVRNIQSPTTRTPLNFPPNSPNAQRNRPVIQGEQINHTISYQEPNQQLQQPTTQTNLDLEGQPAPSAAPGPELVAAIGSIGPALLAAHRTIASCQPVRSAISHRSHPAIHSSFRII